jgi:hypothetical protein
MILKYWGVINPILITWHPNSMASIQVPTPYLMRPRSNWTKRRGKDLNWRIRPCWFPQAISISSYSLLRRRRSRRALLWFPTTLSLPPSLITLLTNSTLAHQRLPGSLL